MEEIMLITASKPVLPGMPFGRNDGTMYLADGATAYAMVDFTHAGVKIPKGTKVFVVARNDRFISYELEFPKISGKH